jgi:hypothetical protein
MYHIFQRIDYKGYLIGTGNPGWYVCNEGEYGNMNKDKYMHKDLSFHSSCGADNFYPTLKLAKEAVDALEYKKNKHEFITEGEFSS